MRHRNSIAGFVIAAKKGKSSSSAPGEIIYSRIYVIRKQKVMVDFDLASLYKVKTKALNQAVRRNLDRFPADFMFRLTSVEWASLRSQFVTLEGGRGKFPKYIPYAFTEQGVAMLSSVLNSRRAIAVNIQIMRLFVKMRQMIAGYKKLLKKIEKVEKAQTESNQEIASIYKIINDLLMPSVKNRPPVGFKMKNE